MDSMPSPYDVPLELRQELKPAANGELDGRSLNDMFDDITDPEGAIKQFKNLRQRLYRDAQSFYKNPQLPPRPDIPHLGPGANIQAKNIIKSLYKETRSLVVGESHASIGSKQFLIENMEVLSKQKVRTLYMEHLLTDYHQADLDIFNRGGELSEDLRSYLKNLDQGHRTDPAGEFTFLEVVKAAQKNHIRVQAIDCAASYRSDGMYDVSDSYRQEMMNYFSKTVIDADQTLRGPHNWIALVGDSHANNWKGVPGLSELEGGIGLRVESAEAGVKGDIEPDPGKTANSPDGLGQEVVKNDLRLQVELPPGRIRRAKLEAALNKPGMLTIDRFGSQTVLIHRSSNHSLVVTPIEQDTKGLYINRPKWGSLSNKRFASLIELGEALDRIGLTRVRVP
jgi:hypothetical protein